MMALVVALPSAAVNQSGCVGNRIADGVAPFAVVD